MEKTRMSKEIVGKEAGEVSNSPIDIVFVQIGAF